jgi:hypothetical protein
MNQDIKNSGSDHYKTGGVEPLDLMEAGDIVHDFAIGSIIKYAFRNRKEMHQGIDKLKQDMDKIIHYAEIIKESTYV